MEAHIRHDVLRRRGGGALGLAGAFTSPETLELDAGVFIILMYMELLLIYCILRWLCEVN